MLTIADYLRETQIKTRMSYHLTLIRRTIIYSLKTISAGKGKERREPSYSVSGNAKCCLH